MKHPLYQALLFRWKLLPYAFFILFFTFWIASILKSACVLPSAWTKWKMLKWWLPSQAFMGKAEWLYHLEDDLKQALFFLLINPPLKKQEAILTSTFLVNFPCNDTEINKECRKTELKFLCFLHCSLFGVFLISVY